MDPKKDGLYPDKFIVKRSESVPPRSGRDHKDCEYFVLDLTHDPYAAPAIAAYQAACDLEYPRLAEDLRAMLALSKSSMRSDLSISETIERREARDADAGTS